ncbi:hypothetical protein V8G54_002654 [Vigna mungo]|uniref:Uncharacterized protein n=1 Tax=Vigna mungo TaxID=3915 RepID=A0AAQ3PBC7_VIGMU
MGLKPYPLSSHLFLFPNPNSLKIYSPPSLASFSANSRALRNRVCPPTSRTKLPSSFSKKIRRGKRRKITLEKLIVTLLPAMAVCHYALTHWLSLNSGALIACLCCRRRNTTSLEPLCVDGASFGGHGGYPGGKLFVTAEELGEKLAHLHHEKALIAKLVDIVDYYGIFLSRVRDLVGSNPLILVVTKVDLLPRDTDHNCVGHWVVEATMRKKLKLVSSIVLSVHLTTSKSLVGVTGVISEIQKEKILFSITGLTGLFCPCVLFVRNVERLKEDTPWTRPCMCHDICIEGGISLAIATATSFFPAVDPGTVCLIVEGLFFTKWICGIHTGQVRQPLQKKYHLKICFKAGNNHDLKSGVYSV